MSEHPDLLELGPELDELARAAGRPFALSGWVEGLREHATGQDRSRIVAVRADGRLIGVAPWTEWRGNGVREWRVVGGATSHRAGLVVRPGHERAATAAFAAHAAEAGVDVLHLDGLDAADDWSGALRRAWPRPRPLAIPGLVLPAPVVVMADGWAQWLAGRSKNFRRDLKRKRRAVAQRGGVLRLSDAATTGTDVDALLALHHARFAATGRSSNVSPDEARGVRAAAVRLAASGHLRLWVCEADGAVVGAWLCVHAGDVVASWNLGIHPGWERESLGFVLLGRCVEDAHELGARQLDLGGGDQAYKQRFADGDQPLRWSWLVPCTSRTPRALLHVAPGAGRAARVRAARRVPAERKAQLRRLTSRG